MAAGRPYYKRFPGDFLMGTIGMDLETRGAYSVIIDLLNDRDRPIPDEPRFMAGILNVSPRKWGIIREKLLADPAKLYVDRDGCLTNPRFERERAARAGEHEEAVENGRRGGQKSAALRAQTQGDLDLSASKTPRNPDENAAKVQDNREMIDGDPSKTNGLGEAPPQPSRARQSPEARGREEDSPSSSDSLPAIPLDPIELSDHFTRIAGVRNIEPARIIANQQIVREWIALDVPMAEVERAIIAARERASGPVHSLKYFDGAIRKAQARRTHPHERDRQEQSAEIADPLLRRYLERGGSLDS